MMFVRIPGFLRKETTYTYACNKIMKPISMCDAYLASKFEVVLTDLPERVTVYLSKFGFTSEVYTRPKLKHFLG